MNTGGVKASPLSHFSLSDSLGGFPSLLPPPPHDNTSTKGHGVSRRGSTTASGFFPITSSSPPSPVKTSPTTPPPRQKRVGGGIHKNPATFLGMSEVGKMSFSSVFSSSLRGDSPPPSPSRPSLKEYLKGKPTKGRGRPPAHGGGGGGGGGGGDWSPTAPPSLPPVATRPLSKAGTGVGQRTRKQAALPF